MHACTQKHTRNVILKLKEVNDELVLKAELKALPSNESDPKALPNFCHTLTCKIFAHYLLQ